MHGNGNYTMETDIIFCIVGMYRNKTSFGWEIEEYPPRQFDKEPEAVTESFFPIPCLLYARFFEQKSDKRQLLASYWM